MPTKEQLQVIGTLGEQVMAWTSQYEAEATRGNDIEIIQTFVRFGWVIVKQYQDELLRLAQDAPITPDVLRASWIALDAAERTLTLLLATPEFKGWHKDLEPTNYDQLTALILWNATVLFKMVINAEQQSEMVH